MPSDPQPPASEQPQPPSGHPASGDGTPRPTARESGTPDPAPPATGTPGPTPPGTDTPGPIPSDAASSGPSRSASGAHDPIPAVSGSVGPSSAQPAEARRPGTGPAGPGQDAGVGGTVAVGGGAGATAVASPTSAGVTAGARPTGTRTAAGTALAAPPRPAPTQPKRSPQTPPVPPPLNGPWPDPSVFAHRWPGPGRPASPATVAALLTAAVIAALSIPLDRGGVGWLITAIAGTAALAVARRVPHRRRTSVPLPNLTFPVKHPSPDRYGWAAATVALLGVGTLRSAGWLFVLCVATAALTGALAVAGGRSARAMVVAATMAPLAAFRSVPWVVRGVAALRRQGPAAGGGTRIAATIAVSVALLVVFGSLFASADEAFADVLERAVPDINVGTVARWVWVFLVAGGLLGGAAYLRAAPPDLSGMTGGRPGRVTRLEWAIPLGLLTVLFAMFVAVQLAVLFGGSRHVLNTDGLTYANYARGGFWQLLAVTGLTLVVLAGAVRWAPRNTPADRTLIRVILGALAVLTLVIVASALHRMDVYADTYGLTRLRVLVFLCELWLGLTFVLVLVAGVRLRGDWVPRAVVAIGVLTLLGLAAANPDGLIAERNIARYEQTGRIDLPHLSGLSADAVPALDRLDAIDPVQRDCALSLLDRRLRNNPDDWRGWSYGREHARNLLAADPPGLPANCPTDYRH